MGRILPGAQSESYVYDLTGNLVYQTNFNGVVITNQYDPMNRLTSRLSAGNYKVSYAYNPTTGLRTSMTDVTGLTSYQYDGLNRLTQKTVAWTNGPTASLNYGYDATGLLTALGSSSSGGVTNVYQYDLLGRLTNVLANGSAAATYGFDAMGNLQTMRFGSGVTNLYQYDSRNRLTNLVWKLNSTALASFGYTVGLTGNRTALAESLNSTSRSYGWTYDLLYRMTGETMSGIGSVNYQFDTVGNRTNRTSTVSGLNNQAFVYNPNDWLTNTDTYDNNGNTTASAGTAYQYDVLNHLTNANSGAIVMGSDGDGNRVKKTVSGTTTYFLLDERNPSGYVQVVEEYQGSTLTALYNFGLDLVNQKQSGTIRYYGYDGHGSTRFLTGTNGTVTDTYVYDAYGNKITSTGSSVNKYLYCGEQFDSDLNQYYLRARYYRPDTGRFWTMDSYGGSQSDPLSLHKYLYCANNSINNIDPSGHDDLADIMLSMQIRAYMFAQTMAPVFHAVRIGIATISLVGFIADAEFRDIYMASAGSPGEAAQMLAADIRFVGAEASGLVRLGTAEPNVINLRFNGGDASDFRVKTGNLKRAADAGGLTVVSNPSGIRDASAQVAYRKAVSVRYTRYLQQLGMSESEATAQATKKFQTLQADHKIDLQVGGALSDPNSADNLQMLDGKVNMSVGSQLQKEIQRLGLQTGDQINQVNVINK